MEEHTAINLFLAPCVWWLYPTWTPFLFLFWWICLCLWILFILQRSAFVSLILCRVILVSISLISALILLVFSLYFWVHFLLDFPRPWPPSFGYLMSWHASLGYLRSLCFLNTGFLAMNFTFSHFLFRYHWCLVFLLRSSSWSCEERTMWHKLKTPLLIEGNS
jgi:hypothetical protein